MSWKSVKVNNNDIYKGDIMFSVVKKMIYLVVLVLLAGSLNTVHAMQSGEEIKTVLQGAYNKYKGLQEGANADYIPALAEVDPDLFGIALITVDGEVYTIGDVTTEVSIQSISKVFTMARVIQDSGPDAIAANMGVDATGQVFNSIVAVEQYQGSEMNAKDRYACPRCGGGMVRMVDAAQPHIWFEKCASCSGAFFDAGEFRDLSEQSISDFFKDLFSPERG